MSKKGFIAFLNSVKNLLAKGFHTDVRLQILNDVCKQTLFYELYSVELMTDEEEFYSILDDLSSFITLGENLVKKWDIPEGGEVSDMALIRNKLIVEFDLRDKESFNKEVIPMFSIFRTQHDDIMDDVSVVNQRKYVETFVGVNVKEKKNPQVKELFETLRDIKPKITNLNDAFKMVIHEYNVMAKICAKAYLYGMRFTPNNPNANIAGGKGGG